MSKLEIQVILQLLHLWSTKTPVGKAQDELQDLVEDNTALDKYRRVAHVEEFYDIIRDVHEKELLHGGYKKTFDKVQSLVTEYEWEWLSSVAEFVSRASKKRGRKICIFVPIMSASETPAINSSSKANYCKWICLQIASILNTHIFPYFGVPRILHSDNGQEFVNMVIVDLLKCWNSNIQLMAAEISASGMKTPPWSDWLPRIVYAMNIQVHDTTCRSISNVVNEAEDTLHAEVSAAECETIEREVLEKNDDKLNGNELKCNGKRKCLREDALSHR
ncbi:hypothetical protein EMCRGX_G024301 [Ephydatia muelleri]